jgi:hypothetical protein
LLAGVATASAVHALLGHAMTRFGAATTQGSGPWLLLLLTALAAALAAAWLKRWRTRTDDAQVRHTHLAFNGERWSWPHDACPVTLSPRLDFGSWMLVEVQGGPSRQWLALSRTMDPGAWHALRVALFAHASPVPLRSV